jgi:hypothetical protein
MLSLVGFTYRMLDEYQAVEKDQKAPIKDFLDSLFEFNPDWHVRKASDSESEENKVPVDTFHRWRHYEDVNYDKYRKLTEELYLVKANMDYVIDVYDCFETLEDAKSFQKMHQEINPIALLELQKYYTEAFMMFKKTLLEKDLETIKQNL